MEKFVIKVGARSSNLSKVQVKEVFELLNQHHPSIAFDPIYMQTKGDKDRQTSLRTLEKTDFFTKEIDQLLSQGKCRIAVHSAKDLPDPISPDLAIAAITMGIDSGDMLVIRAGETLSSLPSGATIATSSIRREEAVKQLRKDFTFCDLRGTIEERIALLNEDKVDGVVIAEAALIRLGMTHLNRFRLPGETTANQGKLAILCRKDDKEMLELFRCLDSREKNYKILYLGLDLPENVQKNHIFVHYPIIRIHLLPPTSPLNQDCFKDIPSYTHLLFTSKSAVHAFFRNFSYFGYKTHHLHSKAFICVGKQTAKTLKAYGVSNPLHPTLETAEGMIDLLESLSFNNPYFFWPHSAISRPVISHYLKQKKFRFKECILYDTVINRSLPSIELQNIDEICFTSPSTVDAFKEIFGDFPKDKILKAIGPITQQKLNQLVKINVHSPE